MASSEAFEEGERLYVQEVALEVTDENNRLEGIVHSKVKTTVKITQGQQERTVHHRQGDVPVDNDTDDGGEETSVETSNTLKSTSTKSATRRSVERSKC